MNKGKKSQSKLLIKQDNINQDIINQDKINPIIANRDFVNNDRTNQTTCRFCMKELNTDELNRIDGNSSHDDDGNLNQNSDDLKSENSIPTQVQNLQTFRIEIDRIDQILIENIIKRFIVTDQVGMYKKYHELPLVDGNREQAIYVKNRERINSFFENLTTNSLYNLDLNQDFTIKESKSLTSDDSTRKFKFEIMEIIDKLFEIIIENSVTRQEKI